ncbi:tRNA pseudouridine synthase A [Sesamum alatum]|uniref:tRNA pseudouridine synthase n=1 Tax=Sesamum alatum TaxID=300844 RepID=A0AAE1Y651_9LAMI|nr:tRNA pseudouridine synthase A [Sesamum alatum]
MPFPSVAACAPQSGFWFWRVSGAACFVPPMICLLKPSSPMVKLRRNSKPLHFLSEGKQMAEEKSSLLISRSFKQLRNQWPESVQRTTEVANINSENFTGESVEEEDADRGLIEKNMNPNPGIQRYLVAIEYIGTRFSGAQKQSSGRTVVGVLEDAFKEFIGQPVSIFCSSRTDAGVHALSNVCHVDIERISKRKPGEVLPPHEPSVVKNAVNHFLQKNEGDIMVTDVRCVPADFHARYEARERTYFYRLLSGKEPLAIFEKDRAWHVPEELDLLAMQKACQVLVGHHDFSSFRGAACQAKSPIRTLDELSVTEVASSPYIPTVLEREHCINGMEDSFSSSYIPEAVVHPVSSTSNHLSKIENSGGAASQGFGTRKRHRCFVVTARARSFLYHQVRLLVGVLKSVGTGDLTVSDVERILNAKNVAAARPMAPACGLYLGHVKYDLPSN